MGCKTGRFVTYSQAVFSMFGVSPNEKYGGDKQKIIRRAPIFTI